MAGLEKFPDPEEMREWSSEAFRKAYDILKTYPKSTLNSIAKTFNHWGWDGRLGEKPHNWDELMPYRKPWMPPCEIVRADYIRPYMSVLLVCGIDY